MAEEPPRIRRHTNKPSIQTLLSRYFEKHNATARPGGGTQFDRNGQCVAEVFKAMVGSYFHETLSHRQPVQRRDVYGT
jgi:hypothetical protein